MTWPRILRAIVGTTVCLPASPGPGRAQGTGGGIGGVVKDGSGGVLPGGVTVEASSPVLIEKVRTVLTDDQAQYKLLDLLPGTYSVTFSLAGFSTIKRDGIELTSNFTAPVNVEMRVGALEETINVSGQAPVVDTQNVVHERVVSREQLFTLPINRVRGLQVVNKQKYVYDANLALVGPIKREISCGSSLRTGSSATRTP
jgi:carboxypeptidase family protein